jgi:hypothetical protein
MPGFVFVQVRPLTAEGGLRGAPVGSDSSVERTAYSVVFIEISTCRNDLAFHRVLIFALDLAQVRRLSSAQQCLQALPALRDVEFQREITATGRSLLVVGGSAWRAHTWVLLLNHR